VRAGDEPCVCVCGGGVISSSARVCRCWRGCLATWHPVFSNACRMLLRHFGASLILKPAPPSTASPLRVPLRCSVVVVVCAQAVTVLLEQSAIDWWRGELRCGEGPCSHTRMGSPVVCTFSRTR
jgi:hypothetical protein